MFLRFCRSATGLVLLLAATQTSASPPSTSIQYSLVPLGGNVYRYVYSITNNGPIPGGSPVQLFDILFDTSLYQQTSLQIVTPSSLHAQWSEILLSGIPPSVPALYDALALTGGIPPGSTVSGFSVQFTWLGPGTPGSQPFQVYDPNTFQLLQSGQTSANSAPLTVPAASTVSLTIIGVGLILTGAYRMIQKPRTRTS